MIRPRGLAAAALLLGAVLTYGGVANSGSLKGALTSTFPKNVRDEGKELAHVFASSVAAAFPVAGVSKSFVWGPKDGSDQPYRFDIPLGPVFSERAETLGTKSALALAVNYAFLSFDSINGERLDHLVSKDPRTSNDALRVARGSFSEPVQMIVDLDVEAHIVALSATYGLRDDLDVNLLVPIVSTYLRAHSVFTAPDPRVPPDPRFFLNLTDALSAERREEGLGDVLLRLKRSFGRIGRLDWASGASISIPTGSESDFHGTGDTELGVGIYASRTIEEIVQPHMNLSGVLNVDEPARSQLRYSLGVDWRVRDWLTLNADFLGRSEVAQPDSGSHHAFVQLERADTLQASLGFKIRPQRRVAFFANALLPLNRDGMRADATLTVGLEASFDVPSGDGPR